MAWKAEFLHMNETDLQAFQDKLNRFGAEGFTMLWYQIVPPVVDTKTLEQDGLIIYSHHSAVHCAVLQKMVEVK